MTVTTDHQYCVHIGLGRSETWLTSDLQRQTAPETPFNGRPARRHNCKIDYALLGLSNELAPDSYSQALVRQPSHGRSYDARRAPPAERRERGPM